jgi:hypothetical protein
VEKLEVLLFLLRTPNRYWSAQEVATALALPEAMATRILDALCARNLLDVRTASDVQFRFAPLSDGLAESVKLLEGAYRNHRSAVLSLILSRTERSVREFADAFRIKKEDTDG